MIQQHSVVILGALLGLSVNCAALGATDAELITSITGAADCARLDVEHPIPGAVLPANLPAPLVLWKTNGFERVRWAAVFKAGTRAWVFEGLEPRWHPPEADWSAMKQAAKGSGIELIVAGLRDRAPVARASLSFIVSSEKVNHPLFYREVNLPFSEAVKDPSKIRWRFGPIDTVAGPPVVLSNLPVCGNCHSFSRNGQHLAMDVDYANSKASYVVARTAPEMVLATSDIITWDEFRKSDGQQTFGLLSQISPDGRHVLSTVKDRSVFVPRPNLAFSQLFFPLKGILAVYDREEKRFSSLPGADDPAYVQSNPTWSPDGQWVLFARNRAAELEKPQDGSRVLLTPEECEEFLKRGKEFRYDLYRVPFNDGKGGKPEPLRGASGNGRSNFFPKYSPDGRWIVFCQASNYMLLQPDSELFIVPAEGGTARRLACNLGRMNSWHSWSPDGKWLVFSSKAHSDYTQLYLSRISEAGEASQPVWLDHLVAPGRAANIPEFVALAPDAIVRIKEQFLDDYSYTRAGNEFYRAGDADNAIEKFRLALSLNPNNAMAHQRLGFLLQRVKNRTPEALNHMQAAVRLEPKNGFAQFDLGQTLLITGDVSNAVPHLEAATSLIPNGYDRQYNAVDMNYTLAEACFRLAMYHKTIPALERSLKSEPGHARANYLMAMARAWIGETDTAKPYFEQAARSEPRLKSLPDFYDLLSRNYLEQGKQEPGLATCEMAYQLALKAGRSDQAHKLRQRAEIFRGQSH
jgi:tetratricopeptide (TPR) repeat protein